MREAESWSRAHSKQQVVMSLPRLCPGGPDLKLLCVISFDHVAPMAISVSTTTKVKSTDVSWVLTSGGYCCLVGLDKLWNHIVSRFLQMSNGPDNKLYLAVVQGVSGCTKSMSNQVQSNREAHITIFPLACGKPLLHANKSQQSSISGTVGHSSTL